MSAKSCTCVGSPPQQDRLGTDWLGSSSAKKDLEFLGDNMVPWPQRGPAASWAAQEVGEVIVSLCSALVKLRLDTASHFRFKLEEAQQRDTSLVGQEHLPCEEGAVQPGEEMALGGPNSSPPALTGR